MKEIRFVVHDPEKVKDATSMARKRNEKLADQAIKIMLFAGGRPASHMLINDGGKISAIAGAGGEVISCVHDLQDAQLVAKARPRHPRVPHRSEITARGGHRGIAGLRSGL